MPDIDVDEIERRARAATQGTWTVRPVGVVRDVQRGGFRDTTLIVDSATTSPPNLAHIAASHPDAVLGIIEFLRESEQQRHAALARVGDLQDENNALRRDMVRLLDALEVRKVGESWPALQALISMLRERTR